MRLLVQCAECRRQFDATGREVGSRFRCHCGSVVVVGAPQSHDASVTRCSSCGGAREEGAATCGFCGSDFTLRERDLHTICPNCLARVSDRARFCHHCGTRLEGEQSVDSVSNSVCPVCESAPPLSHRTIGDVNLLECGHCAGLWVGHAAFEGLLAKARDRSADEVTTTVDGRPRPASVHQPGGAMYRKCIECGEHMSRRNYGRVSGVIVDICRDHGVWFDADELDAVLRWVRQGGDAATRHAEQQEKEYQRRLARVPEVPKPIGAPPAGLATDLSMRRGGSTSGFADTLATLIVDLFR